MVRVGYQLLLVLATGERRPARNRTAALTSPLILSSPDETSIRRVDFHLLCGLLRWIPRLPTSSLMSSLRLSNHFSDCRLISLSKLKVAAETPGCDAHGPYLIAQDGPVDDECRSVLDNRE